MTDLIKVTRTKPREDRWVRVWFSNGAVKDVDISNLLARGRLRSASRRPAGV